MSNDRTAAMDILQSINAVEGFDPSALAVDYTDLNSSETRKRLPVMAQLAWFRLKYPDGRISVTVAPVSDYFVATARVYKDYHDPIEHYLAEATASRGYLRDKPSVSPREWAQTAAVGIALRNAGFGLNFHAAGDSSDDPAVLETGEIGDAAPPTGSVTAGSAAETPEAEQSPQPEGPPAEQEELTFELACTLPCPIAKLKGKTLGDLITLDPKALVWIATKFSGDPKLTEAAKLICEQAAEADMSA